jgi:hypothetical protein
MKSRIHVFTAILAVLLLAAISSAIAQKKPKMKPNEILSAAKPGQWVQMEGVVQKDFSVLCTDVKILTGDIPANQWSMEGFARDIDPSKNEFKMLLVSVKAVDTTEFKSKSNQAFKSLTDLKPEMLVEVDGIYQKNGTFLALEVEDKSEKLATKPHLQNMIETYGKVEKIDTARRTMTVMGITFQLTDRSEGEYAVN